MLGTTAEAVLGFTVLWVSPVAVADLITGGESGMITEFIKTSPIAAAMIILVVLFLRFLKSRDADFRDVIKANTQSHNEVAAQLGRLREHCKNKRGDSDDDIR